MDEQTANTLGTLMAFLLLIGGGVILQIFLSRRQSRWPGLVLPGVTVLYSLLMVLGVAAFNGGLPWGPILACLIFGNIPTLVLLAIYFACRGKYRRRRALDKMNAQDLE